MNHKSSLGLTVIAVLLGACWLITSNPTLFTYLLCAAGVVLGVAAAAMIVYVIWWQVHNAMAPVTRVEATVVLKRSKEWDVSVSPATPDKTIGSLGLLGRDPVGAAKALLRWSAVSDDTEIELAHGEQYIIIFSFDGRQEEFVVPESTFATVIEGDTGLLSFTGEKFISFIPDLRRPA